MFKNMPNPSTLGKDEIKDLDQQKPQSNNQENITIPLVILFLNEK